MLATAYPFSRLRILAFLCSILAVVSPAAAQDSAADSATTSDTYLMQPGDVLEVSVWGEEYLERDVAIQPDGMISFPLVGVLPAAGGDVRQLQEKVAEKLSQYIPDPVVTVSIKDIRGNRIYVIGQVQRPGHFVMNPKIDVMQALALAGGTTPFAALNDIRILRRSGGKLTSIEFRYGDVEKGRNLQQNIILQSGDVIIVP